MNRSMFNSSPLAHSRPVSSMSICHQVCCCVRKRLVFSPLTLSTLLLGLSLNTANGAITGDLSALAQDVPQCFHIRFTTYSLQDGVFFCVRPVRRSIWISYPPIVIDFNTPFSFAPIQSPSFAQFGASLPTYWTCSLPNGIFIDSQTGASLSLSF